MWKLLGLSSTDTTPSKPAPSRTLPASWYASSSMFQLERRAIFQRKWIVVTHSMGFKEAGDYQSYNYASISFFLVRDRDGKINGFHNLCRHRAFPIIQSDSGNAKILSCRYHGWSYGYKGNLAKAPRFDSVEGFDKSQHSLLPIHVHIDKSGFIWVNLDAEQPTPWEQDFGGVDETERMKSFDFAKEFAYDHTWEIECKANWKAVIDNYNECYHCPTSHPLIAGVTDLTKYTVDPSGSSTLQHTIINKEGEQDGQFRRSISFYFPGTSVTATGNFFYIQRMVPIDEKTTVVQNEIYRHKNATDEEFAAINAFYKQVLEEDKVLCDGAQKNLNNGIYISGEMHPQKERGPITFQQIVRKEVMEHRAKEEKQGQEIWPAVPKPIGEMKTCRLDEEEMFCTKLEAASCATNAELAW